MKLIVLGAPGSGKGTLTRKIENDFSIKQISVGDLFRKIIKKNDNFAKKIKKIIKNGDLVPDEITFEILKEKLKDYKNGFILDGYPRTLKQAKLLENISNVDAVILIEVSEDKIIDRISSRRVCQNCGEIFGMKDNIDKCSKCGHDLIQRDDDKPEVVKNRLEVYKNEITPLINFYSDRLLKVSNENDSEEMYRSVKTFLKTIEAKNE